MNRRFRLIALACLVLALAGSAFSQTPTGAIEGIIIDPSGASIANARVTVTETATGRNIPLSTNETGYYSARNLLPGVYNVKVEAPGFAIKELRDVVVNSGAVVNGNSTLEIGKTGEVVEVNAAALTVDTSRQTVDTVINEKEIKNLPVFSRNFLDLASLAPGVTIRDGEAIDPTKAFAYRAVSIAGRSGTGTRVQIDGIDVTDETVGTTTANVSQEAVNQFQLTRSSLDISTSLTSSGAINVITNSGGNALHGSGFFDYYNQDMGARQQYESQAADFNRKRFGGSLGGPFIKNKLFWYGNFERTYQNSLSISRVPEFPQLNIAQGFPTGVRYGLARLDWNVTSALRLFYKFQHNWDVSTGGSAPSPFQNIDWTNTHTFGADLTRARATNAFRFGYVNFNNRIDSQELTLKFPRLGATAYNLSVGPYNAGPNGLAPQATYQDNWQFSYDGSYVWGRNTLRYGGGYTKVKLGGFANFAGPLSINGVYDADTITQLRGSGVNLQDPLNYPLDTFSLGPANGFFTLQACHGLAHGCHYNNRTSFFVGDNIKATRRLTLNLGLRYEYDSGYFNYDKHVKRDPILETWGKGFSKIPSAPHMFSPSFGFAFDPTGSGKSSIRGGFYKAYEMNIFNNLLFDEFANLPPGIGPDTYDITGVTGPDGTPINVAGHPDGDYTDLQGRPIREVLPIIVQVNSALQSTYANYKFDPTKGDSAFRVLRGITFGGIFPGDQFKVPYSLQFNLGFQHELRPGTVISVDYIHNHGVGLPFFLRDFEMRRDASTLNVAAARNQVNKVLKGQTVDQYIAANPKATIRNFTLATDAIFTGLTPDFARARFLQGGFTRYRALQINLRGRAGQVLGLKETVYNISYAYGASESSAAAGRAEFITNPLDNHRPNNPKTFGPTGLDYRHIFTASGVFNVPGGVRLNSVWRFRTPPAGSLFVPNLGGAISGANGIFGTDLNGDGGTGSGSPRSDVFPGVDAGEFGRKVHSLSQLNKIIQQFNSTYAGHLTPHGQALVNAGLFTEAQLKQLGAVVPAVPLIPGNAPNPWHYLFTTDVRIDRPIRFRERVAITPFADIINLFNHAPSNVYSGLNGRFGALNFDYAAAAAGQHASDLAASNGRNTGTRQIQVGIRADF